MKLNSLKTSTIQQRVESKNFSHSRIEKKSSSNLLTTLLSVALMQSSHGLLNSPVCHQGPMARHFFSPNSCLAAFEINSNPDSQKIRFRTQLWYRHGDSYDSQERKREHENAMDGLITETQDQEKGWGSVFFHNQNEGDRNAQKQEKMDKYLEFLDRRYNRLHSEDVSSKNEKGGMKAPWNWLFENSGESDPNPQSFTQIQDDALYVLGVAELASERLLQKHHLKMQNQVALETHVDSSLQTIDTYLKSNHRKSLGKRFLCRLQASQNVLKVLLKRECTHLFSKFLVSWGDTVKTLRKQKYSAFSLMGIILALVVAAVMNTLMQL